MKITDNKIDGTLYVFVAVFGYLSGVFGSDDAFKHIAPVTLFYLKTLAGSGAAGSLALKMFRSTAFADAKAERNGNGNGTTVTTTVKPAAPLVQTTVETTKQPNPVKA